MLSASRQVLSASAGSFRRRYRSALASVLGTASGDKVFSSNMLTSAEHSQQLHEWIVQLVDDALFQRNDGVVRNGDAFRTHFRAALRDVAVPNPELTLQVSDAILGVERVHLERCAIYQVTRTHELVEERVIAQHVADVLAEEALDAFAELLHALDVDLRHAPGAVRGVGRPRLELADARLGPKVPRHVGDEITDGWKRAHRLDGNALRQVELIQARHAHQSRIAVHFRRTGTALSGLAVPADGKVVRLLRLDLVNGIEHDHAIGDLGRIVAEFATARIAAPDSECPAGRHYFISSMTCFSSAGISRMGTRDTSIAPSRPFR